MSGVFFFFFDQIQNLLEMCQMCRNSDQFEILIKENTFSFSENFQHSPSCPRLRMKTVFFTDVSGINSGLSASERSQLSMPIFNPNG